MKRINYTLARLLAFLSYALLVFIFCGIMIAQLDNKILASGDILAKAQGSSTRLQKVYALHSKLAEIFPLSGSLREKRSLLGLADEYLESIRTHMQELEVHLRGDGNIKENRLAVEEEYTEVFKLKEAYYALRTLRYALLEEFEVNQYSEDTMDILEAVNLNLHQSIDNLVKLMNKISEKLIEANSSATAQFVELKSYLINLCVVIAIILFGSAVYLNRLLREPVRELAKAADEIRLGNLEYTLDVRDIPRDELGMLMRNFNVMARRLSHTASRLEEANRNLQQEADSLNTLAVHKTQFIRHLGHELRAPLSSIIGFAELMMEGYYGDLTEKQENYLGRITKSANHLLALVNDLVDQAKMQAGTLRLNYEDYKLSEFVQEIVSSFEAKADKEGILIRFDGGDVNKNKMIEFDGKRIRQALINLISNSLKFTPEGESVTVHLHADALMVYIDVKDTGIGIAEEELEQIFQEFHQASTLKSSEGAGLGLPLSRQLVILHHGDISVESELGKGACFTLKIPLKKPSDFVEVPETQFNFM